MADLNGSGRHDDSRQSLGPSSTTTTTTTFHGPHTTTTTTFGSAAPRTVVSSNTPQSWTVTHPTITTTSSVPVPTPIQATPPSNLSRQPSTSIRVRRLPAAQSLSQTRDLLQRYRNGDLSSNGEPANRRRSSSEPQRPNQAPYTANDLDVRRQLTATPLAPLQEEGSGATTPQFLVPQTIPERPRRAPLQRQDTAGSINARSGEGQEYGQDVIDMLDVIDPEVSTLTTLNNVQNSLFIPNLGAFYRRQPTYDLTASPAASSDEEVEIGVAQGFPETDLDRDFPRSARRTQSDAEKAAGQARPGMNRLETTNTISSVLTGMSEGHNYAVLPHGASLPGWSAEDKAALNNHVRHLLHSKRAKFRRGMRGFRNYVRKPVGFLVTLYAFLLTFWGAAWVLFLIGWISVGGRQAYFIEICDQILTALFCVVGIGFAPWRAVDTYHMIYIAHYAHLTWKLRKKRGLPDLRDHNELPTIPGEEHARENPEEEPEGIVLSEAQQKKLEHHQEKFAKSHTFYKPHETPTHYAFPLRLLIAIVVLLDFHSLFQMALGGTTWGIYYKDRPKALTAVILTCSISCNISAGITISIGDRKSRKKLIVEQMFRQGITEEAMQEIAGERGLKVSGIKQKKKDKKKEGEK